MQPTPASAQTLDMTQALPAGEIATWDKGEIPLFVRMPQRRLPQPGVPTVPRGVLVSIHGNNRQAAVHALRFSELAHQHDLVLIAPSFARAEHPHFQRLARNVDAALTRTIQDLLEAHGVPHTAWLWFGHSAGAQFVHRYTYRHPERVLRAALSAAGWYTLPDATLRFPYGLAGFTGQAPMQEVLAVPQRVFIGGQDVHSGDALRREPALDLRQGETRLDRARSFVREMREAARTHTVTPGVSLRELRGAGHDFDANMHHTPLGRQVLHFLLGDAPAAPTITAEGGVWSRRTESCACTEPCPRTDSS